MTGRESELANRARAWLDGAKDFDEAFALISDFLAFIDHPTPTGEAAEAQAAAERMLAYWGPDYGNEDEVIVASAYLALTKDPK